MGLPQLLQVRHRLLAGTAPGGPEIQNNDLSAQLRELHFLFSVEGGEFDLGCGTCRRQAAVFGHIILNLHRGGCLLVQNAGWNSVPMNATLDLPRLSESQHLVDRYNVIARDRDPGF